MRYLVTIIILLTATSCEKDKKQTYRCECTNIKGQILHEHEGEYENSVDGLPACQGYADSLMAIDSTLQARCYLYNADID